MTTHVERTVTDVVPAPEPAPAGGSAPESHAAELDRLRAALGRAERLAERTRAEDFDD
jgi:hypothetical protein